MICLNLWKYNDLKFSDTYPCVTPMWHIIWPHMKYIIIIYINYIYSSLKNHIALSIVSYSITPIGSDVDTVSGVWWEKSRVFGGCCSEPQKKTICTPCGRGWTQSLPSLLITVDCTSRCSLTRSILISHHEDLVRTQFQVCDDEKTGFSGVSTQEDHKKNLYPMW